MLGGLGLTGFLTVGLGALVPLLYTNTRSPGRECGGAAKPSGAGGGDIAVAVFPDPDARTFFLDRCTRAGLPPVPVRLAPGAAPLEAPR